MPLLLRLGAGLVLIVAGAVPLAAGVQAASRYLVPAIGPLGWAIVVVLSVCGLMVSAPLIGSGVVLLRPRYAEEPVACGRRTGGVPGLRARRAAAPLTADEARPAPPPPPPWRYGLDAPALALVALVAVASVLGGYLLFPQR